MEVESEPGHGTRISLSAPLAEEDKAAKEHEMEEYVI
jgi:hypothetical protein